MKCSSTFIAISSLLIIFISYIYYNKTVLSYNNPPPQNIPKLSCEKYNYTLLMEDFAKVDDNNLIACGANFIDLYVSYSIYNPGYQLEPGNLVPSSPVPYENDVHYPSDNLFSKSTNLIIDDTTYELDFDFLNYMSTSVCDEFVYENGTCYIIRRVGIDENGDIFPLQSEVIEPRKGVILNVKADSTITLSSFPSAILSSTYLLENIFTDSFATEAYVQSNITQTAESITQENDTIQEIEDYKEQTTFKTKTTLWQKIKNSKLVRAATYVFRIRIRIELPSNALPEGRGENL